MPTYAVKYRITHPIEETTVEATSREDAIVQAIALGDEGDEVDVMRVEPVVTEEPPADDATKTSGRWRGKGSTERTKEHA